MVRRLARMRRDRGNAWKGLPAGVRYLPIRIEHLLVVGFIARNNVVRAILAARIHASRPSHLASPSGLSEYLEGIARGSTHVTRLKEKAVFTRRDHFRQASDICSNHGHFAGHGLERGQAERFLLARQQE